MVETPYVKLSSPLMRILDSSYIITIPPEGALTMAHMKLQQDESWAPGLASIQQLAPLLGASHSDAGPWRSRKLPHSPKESDDTRAMSERVRVGISNNQGCENGPQYTMILIVMTPKLGPLFFWNQLCKYMVYTWALNGFPCPGFGLH